jgi:hypothetical protein
MKLLYKTKPVLPLILRRRLFLVSLLLFVVSNFIAADISQAGEVTVISNINAWHHPVKDILIKHKVIIS